jgi:hypothetical protein
VNDKLQVVVDMLREHGFDTEARWIEQREHVTQLLSYRPYIGIYASEHVCAECEADEGTSCFANCKVAAAWRALGDPRALADVERAHDEALADERRRNAPRDPNYRASTMTVMNEFLRNAFTPERLEEALYANPALSLLPRKK